MENTNFLQYFPPMITEGLRQQEVHLDTLREIRIRIGCPPAALADKLYILSSTVITPDLLARTADRICQHSLYARQAELRQGFITLPGGHRAGFCGRAVLEDTRVHHLTDISSITLRIAHQILGAADALMPLLVQGDAVSGTLLISPPGMGKTTLLRDIARQLGGGTYRFRVGLCDERGELAAMYRGMAQNDVGFLTDVFDGCPKAYAMHCLLRSMSPQVLITDELGTPQEAAAVLDAAQAGVSVIATAHGRSRQDIEGREGLKALLSAGIFPRIVVLEDIGKMTVQ